MARPGMADLITKLRREAELGTADYSVAGETYWDDGHVQALLDRHRTFYTQVTLKARGRPIEDDTEYKRYELPAALGDVEGTEGGTPVFRVHTSDGAVVSASEFSFNADDLAIEFTEDRGGTAYYWTGYAYNINKAASDAWTRKAGHAWTAIDFKADGASFNREALHAHCLKMAAHYDEEEGVEMSRMVRSDLGTGFPPESFT